MPEPLARQVLERVETIQIRGMKVAILQARERDNGPAPRRSGPPPRGKRRDRRERQHRHRHHRPGDEPDRKQIKRDEGQIPRRGQEGRTQPVAAGLGLGQRAQRLVARRRHHPGAECTRKRERRLALDREARGIGDARPQEAQHGVEPDRQRHARTQRHERARRPRRQDAVIDRHEEDRDRKPQHMRERGRRHDLRQRPSLPEDGRPDPTPTLGHPARHRPSPVLDPRLNGTMPGEP
ncbi:MAG: hypothetical protein ACO37C_12810 [Gemmobacter sp.]